MRPTIKKIAELAGVTHATVSMVLNNKPGPSEAMKEKILKIVDEVGYVPDINARNLARGKNNTIGIFLLKFPQKKEDRIFYYYMELLQETMMEARKRGYTLLFFTDEDTTRHRVSYAEFCREQNLKTALFLSINKHDKNMAELQNLKTTQIILFDVEETENCNTIISDSYQGIKEMFEYFKEKNKKNIAIITGSEESGIATKKKIKEIDYFSKEFQINVEYYEGNFFMKSGYKIAKKIDTQKFDVIFAMNDAMAVGAMNALIERGIKVPEDIEIIGFDNLAVTSLIKPKLPSIAQDNLKIVEAFFKIIGNEDQIHKIMIPTKFIKN